MSNVVSSLKTVVAMVLLAVWLPATSLCFVERAGWLANDDCCPSSSQSTPDSQPSDETTCCALATATYKADDHRPVAPVAMLLALITLSEAVLSLGGPPSASFSPPPPELPTAWQFAFRAAGSARAPSFVS
jgi:hypothetical protein